MGRTVVKNQLLVNGQPVEESSIGRDPLTPVTSSDLVVLIPASTHISADRVRQNSAPIVTVDASSMTTSRRWHPSLQPPVLP